MQHTRGAVIAIVIALGLAVGPARPAWAQSAWPDDIESTAEPTKAQANARPPTWTVELKFGRYHPNIDAGFGQPAGQGPFDYVYGARPMPLFLAEIDHYFLFPAGELGISLAGGYTYRAGSGFEIDAGGNLTLGDDGQPLRYSGYRTVFRFYPITTGVVYRFTRLDDQLHVPVVPYAKLGLAAYIWRFLRPGKDVEGVVENPMCGTGPCLADRTTGVTLGWQWTLGLAVRLDWFDSWTAEEMHEDGIHHTSLFFEGVGARVNGFGSDSALNVSDTTWFAGMNMEF